MCIYTCVKVTICVEIGQSQVLVLTFSPYMVPRIPESKPVLALQVPYSVFFVFFFFFFSLFLKQGLYVAQASLRNTSQPLFLQVPGYWDCPIQIPYIDKKVWTKLSKLTCKWTEKVVLNICQFYQDSKQTGCLGADLKNLKWEYHHPVLLSLKRRGGDCHSGFFQMQC